MISTKEQLCFIIDEDWRNDAEIQLHHGNKYYFKMLFAVFLIK